MSEIVPRTVPGTNSEVALELPGGLSADDWKRTGETLGLMGRAVQWWIGDWLNYGDKTYGKTYADAAEITGYPEKTLRSFAYVARNVELSRRRDDLSWSHHAEVAAMVGADQERWLTAAAANGWSKGKLRGEIKSMGKGIVEKVSHEIAAGIDKIDPATKPVAEVRKAWEQKRVHHVGLDLPSRDESEWHRQRIDATAERINKTIFPHLRFATERLPELLREKYFGDAISEMDRDWLKALPREIEQARENLLDLARDIERLLAEGES